MRGSPAAAPMLLWLLLSALACTSGSRGGRPSGAGAGGSAAGLDTSTTGGQAAPSEPSGSGGGPSDSGSGGTMSVVPNGPADSGVRPSEAGLDAAPTGPTDAAGPPPDAAADAASQPDCPPVLPEVYGTCSREGLMCEYGMECCPDFAWCEFGQWTLLTHHCDACI